MPRGLATVFARVRRLLRRLTRVDVARPEDDSSSAATDPEVLGTFPPAGGVPPPS
jgi:hypothetical protein